MSAWSHLPNAVHIDRVITSLKAHPEIWNAASAATGMAFWSEAWNVASDAAWDVASDAARNMAWYATRDAAWDVASDAARYIAWGVILALIVYDDCRKYLDMPSEKLETWILLSEQPVAILLLPAVIAFERISELDLV